VDQPSTSTLQPTADPAVARPRTPARAGAARTTEADRYLTFQLDGETYALPILEVAEIIEYRALTSVPMMPDLIRGVLNLRGGVVPVVDLAIRFGRPPTTIGRRTGILIVDARRADRPEHRQQVGILVDAVNKVLHVDQHDLEPAPELGRDLRRDVIKGMARHDEGFIVILSLDNLLAQEHLDHVQATLDAATGTPVGPIGSETTR
jgi:purine-binding chemotaxis protein CheW